MDNWQKYITEQDDKLSIEEVDDKVWQNVYKAAVPKRKSFIKQIKIVLEDLFRKWRIRKEGYTSKRRYSKLRLAYVVVFAAFVIVSCTYKVKSYSKYGDMVTFALTKESYLMINEHSKSLFNSFSSIINPSDSGSVLFLKFIKKNDPETKKILTNIKVQEGVSDLVITPVVVEFKESLFSSFLSNAFQIQINEAKPDVKQIKNKIKDLLKEKGLGSVNIQIDDKKKDVFFSLKNLHQNKQLRIALDTLVITNMDSIAQTISGLQHLDIKMPKMDVSKMKKDLTLMTELTNALEKDGLVDNRKAYKLEIKDGELYINDKKQPKQVSNKFRKYFKNDNYSIINDGDQPASTSNHHDSPKDKPKTRLPHSNNEFPKFDPVQYQKDLKLMYLLIDGLNKDGLIDSKKPYTVQVKEGELYINNKKQPIEVSDKFRKHFKSNNYGIIND